MQPCIRFAAIGLNHGHIYDQVACMLAAGCELCAFCVEEDELATTFASAFPQASRVTDRRRILEDASIQLVLTAAIPSERADIAIQAMRHGKDVMTDKPGAITLEQLDELRRVQAETGRIFSVYYEGRLESRAVTKACDLVGEGAIGSFLHLTALAPHAIRRSQRPQWFFDPKRGGGIIADLATHSCDQFLVLAGTLDARATFARTDNRTNLDITQFRDFGEVCLATETAAAYIRLDWLTPAGLPVYGDGRLFIVGSSGTIEVRDCIDLATGRPGQELFLVDSQGIQRVQCSSVALPYGRQLVADILDRTQTAMTQEHCFRVAELALQAQAMADTHEDL
jgi:predicted dehydrogenase